MTIYDEVNLHTERLIEAWGGVVIECNGTTCLVSDKDAFARNYSECRQYEAATLLEALRLAVGDLEASVPR